MSSKPFFFKSFQVYQDLSPLKLGTDAVLLGSWAMHDQPKSILDIGTGCGVIALMLAQRYPQAMITGIDIQEDSIKDAEMNFRLSAWKHNLMAIEGDVLELKPSEQYDLIVSNPPYFDGTYLSGDAGKDKARHVGGLTIKSIMQCVLGILNEEGSFQLILPFQLCKDAHWEASLVGLYPHRECRVMTKRESEPERVLIEYRKSMCDKSSVTSLFVRNSGSAQQNLEYRKMLEKYYVFM